MVDVDGCVFCSEAHSSRTFAGDASLPTAVLRSPDWIFLCSVAVKKQMHSAGFGFSYHFGCLFCSSGKPSDSAVSIADLQIRRSGMPIVDFDDSECSLLKFECLVCRPSNPKILSAAHYRIR